MKRKNDTIFLGSQSFGFWFRLSERLEAAFLAQRTHCPLSGHSLKLQFINAAFVLLFDCF